LNQSFRYTISGKAEIYCSAACRDRVFFRRSMGGVEAFHTGEVRLLWGQPAGQKTGRALLRRGVPYACQQESEGTTRPGRRKIANTDSTKSRSCRRENGRIRESYFRRAAGRSQRNLGGQRDGGTATHWWPACPGFTAGRAGGRRNAASAPHGSCHSTPNEGQPSTRPSVQGDRMVRSISGGLWPGSICRTGRCVPPEGAAETLRFLCRCRSGFFT
jgi:hypothetical protein